MMTPARVCQLVAACMRLHNICIQFDVPMVNEPVIEEPDRVDIHVQQDGASGVELRDYVIRQLQLN